MKEKLQTTKAKEWTTLPRLREPAPLTYYQLKVPVRTMDTLRRVAESENKTMAKVIRDAIDARYGGEQQL